MSSLSFNSNSDSTNLAVPKLHDDGSNRLDYELWVQKVMGLKGLWRHVEGTTIAPRPYVIVSGIPVSAGGMMAAMEDQIEARETGIIDFDKQEYLAQHIILSTTSTCLGVKIKNLKSAKELWEKVKEDATTKSTLFLIEAEDQLTNM
jgi:hypothetical protein